MGEDEGATAVARRAIDLGPVDLKAIRTPSGRVRLSMTMTIEQLEALLAEARTETRQLKRSVTQCNADTENVTPREDKRREDSDSMMLMTRARDRRESVWVSEGTRAWRAWIAYRRGSIPTTVRQIDGRRHTGWWFPSLFPPASGATGPPQAAE